MERGRGEREIEGNAAFRRDEFNVEIFTEGGFELTATQRSRDPRPRGYAILCPPLAANQQ
jgi:hypothetical protein